MFVLCQYVECRIVSTLHFLFAVCNTLEERAAVIIVVIVFADCFASPMTHQAAQFFFHTHTHTHTLSLSIYIYI